MKEVQSFTSLEGLKIEIEVFMKSFDLLDSLLNSMQDILKDNRD
jgi:hypothetical protein